jgi:hypothetical protein
MRSPNFIGKQTRSEAQVHLNDHRPGEASRINVVEILTKNKADSHHEVPYHHLSLRLRDAS